MDTLSELTAAFEKAGYVQEIEVVIGPIAGSPRTRAAASELFYGLIERDLSGLRGAADEWFNLATSAMRARNYTAAEQIIATAIKQHIDDVDLRCFKFSFCYGHKSIADAREARAELDALGSEKTSTSWRYWCYNAQFESIYLGNKEEAARLLDTALKVVAPADLLNVFRQYRQVLIDGRANCSDPDAKRRADHKDRAQRVEKAFRKGMSLGLETGYVLAIDLAKLLREQTSGMSPSEADPVLEEVLGLLDVAERTYTENANHPLWEIYQEKAITLMARRRYEDALQIFRSLPEYLLSDSTRVMAQYAANMTGQEYKPGDEQAAQSQYDDLRSRLARLEQVTASLVAIVNGGGEAEDDGR